MSSLSFFANFVKLLAIRINWIIHKPVIFCKGTLWKDPKKNKISNLSVDCIHGIKFYFDAKGPSIKSSIQIFMTQT